jgi:hypothetical protein
MERSEIRDLPAPEMKTRIALRSIRATLALVHGGVAFFTAVVARYDQMTAGEDQCIFCAADVLKCRVCPIPHP